MASMLKIHEVNLIRKVEKNYKHIGDNFASIYKAFKESGKCSLRRNQFVLSKNNAAVAIHLGKVYLDQNYVQQIQSTEITPQKKILSLPDNGRREKEIIE